MLHPIKPRSVVYRCDEKRLVLMTVHSPGSMVDHMDIKRFNISPGLSVFYDFWGVQKYALIS